MRKHRMERLLHHDDLRPGVVRRWIAELDARGDHLVSVRLQDYLRALRVQEAQEPSIEGEELSE
jgi:hypothetical protein